MAERMEKRKGKRSTGVCFMTYLQENLVNYTCEHYLGRKKHSKDLIICLLELLAEDFEDLQFISWPIKQLVVQVEFIKVVLLALSVTGLYLSLTYILTYI